MTDMSHVFVIFMFTCETNCYFIVDLAVHVDICQERKAGQ